MTDSLHLLAAVGRCRRVLLRCRDEAGVLPEICQALAEGRECVLALIALVEHEGASDDARSLRLAGYAASGGEHEDPGDPVPRIPLDLGRHADPDELARAGRRLLEGAARDAGSRSSSVWPLIAKGHTIGVLVLHRSGELPVGKEELNLLGELAEDIAWRIHDDTDPGRLLARIEDRYHTFAYQYRLAPNGEHRFGYISNSVRVLLGVTADGMAEGTYGYFLDFVHREDRRAFVVSCMESARNLTPWSQVFRYQLPGQPMRHIRGSSIPRRQPHDGSVVWTGTMVDVSDTVYAEQQTAEVEARFRHLAEHSSDVLTRHALDGLCLDVSPACKSVMGYLPEELIGTMPSDRWIPPDAERQKRVVMTILEKSDRMLTILNKFRRKDGVEIWLETTGQVVLDSFSGKPTEIVCVSRDVTFRVQTENALREREEELRHALERLQEIQNIAQLGDWEYDVAQHRLSWSEKMYPIFGRTMEDGTPSVASLTAMMHESDFGMLESQLRTLSRENPAFDLVARVTLPGDNRRWHHMRGKMVFGEHDEPVKVVGVTLDVTDLKLAEEALQDREAALRETLDRMESAQDIGKFGTWEYEVGSQKSVWSPQVYDMFEHPQELGQPTFKQSLAYYSPDDRKALLDALTACMERGVPFLLELRVRTGSGEVRWQQVSGKALHDAENQVTKLIGTVHDVTELKRAELAVKESESRLRLALENVADGLWDWNIETGEMFVSPSWHNMLGFAAGELPRNISAWMDRCHPEDLAVAADALQRYFDGRSSSYECESRLLHKDGRDVWILSRGKLVARDGNGRPLRMIGTNVDITHRKETEAALRDAKSRAEAATRAKSEFLANMSHEIRTPMNAVIGMAGLLLDSGLTDDQREFAEAIRTAGDALLVIINDILDFSKIEAGRLELERLDFLVREVGEESLEVLTERANSKGLTLGIIASRNLDVWVNGDPGRLRQVLLNLLSNAIKFTDRGSVKLTISLTERNEEFDLVRFEVTDTGIGFTEETKARLFQTFSQAETSTTRKYGGTGLGLAICRRLVQLMGGEIDVTSSPGIGSTFWFQLPFRHVPDSSQRPVFRAVFPGKRVLVVELNPQAEEFLRYHLEAADMMVTSVTSGLDAINYCLSRTKSRPYDLLIIDQALPDMDGLGLVRALLSGPAMRKVPIVLTSMLIPKELFTKARDACVTAVVTKPIRPSLLEKTLLRVFPSKERPASSERQASSVSHGTRRILIAEDNRANQLVARRILEKLDYRADVVANGLEAVAAVREIPYDAVLMDCLMPEMDGYVATRLIRLLSGPAGETVVIGLTANALAGDRERCLASGMDDYLSKPVKRELLEKILRRWIGEGERPRTAADPSSGWEEVIEALNLANPPNLHELVRTFRERLEYHAARCDEAQVDENFARVRECMSEMHALALEIRAEGYAEILRQAQELAAKGQIEVLPGLLRILRDEGRGIASAMEKHYGM